MPTAALAAKGTVRGVFFSLGTTPAHDPQLDCAKAIVDLFNQAQQTAHVAIFTLTEPAIIDAMIAAHKRGVQVAVVADAKQSQSPDNPVQKKMIAKLQQAGVDVRLAVKQTALMHNKVGIFDGKTICSGSFNWTSAAEKRNDENLLVIDGAQVAAAYEKFVFQRILTTETLVKPS
ncbi:MAG TPA: phospholipase D-like domain-containing protein [Caldimonas sp.]|nr:phospholipase D-like domain-containing protein [Caldimonas sp.]